MDTYSVTILGNVEECRTEAEISRDGRVTAIVFESSDGWRTEIVDANLTQPERDLEQALEDARSALSHYVNRLGNDPPQNATRGAFALWLMMKDDGTAMGSSFKSRKNAWVFARETFLYGFVIFILLACVRWLWHLSFASNLVEIWVVSTIVFAPLLYAVKHLVIDAFKW